jgi:hypothetical protein
VARAVPHQCLRAWHVYIKCCHNQVSVCGFTRDLLKAERLAKVVEGRILQTWFHDSISWFKYEDWNILELQKGTLSVRRLRLSRVRPLLMNETKLCPSRSIWPYSALEKNTKSFISLSWHKGSKPKFFSRCLYGYFSVLSLQYPRCGSPLYTFHSGSNFNGRWRPDFGSLTWLRLHQR